MAHDAASAAEYLHLEDHLFARLSEGEHAAIKRDELESRQRWLITPAESEKVSAAASSVSGGSTVMPPSPPSEVIEVDDNEDIENDAMGGQQRTLPRYFTRSKASNAAKPCATELRMSLRVPAAPVADKAFVPVADRLAGAKRKIVVAKAASENMDASDFVPLRSLGSLAGEGLLADTLEALVVTPETTFKDIQRRVYELARPRRL